MIPKVTKLIVQPDEPTPKLIEPVVVQPVIEIIEETIVTPVVVPKPTSQPEPIIEVVEEIVVEIEDVIVPAITVKPSTITTTEEKVVTSTVIEVTMPTVKKEDVSIDIQEIKTINITKPIAIEERTQIIETIETRHIETTRPTVVDVTVP